MEELQQRTQDLLEVAAWSRQNGGLTNGQIICLHQERAGCLRQIAAIENDSPYQGITGYQIPKHLEQKVNHILRVIKDTAWEKKEIKY